MGIYNGEKKMTVSNESSRQTSMDNEVEEDRERDGPTSSSTTSRTCGSRWRTQGIVLNGGEPVWLPLTRGIHSLKERERERAAWRTPQAIGSSTAFSGLWGLFGML